MAKKQEKVTVFDWFHSLYHTLAGFALFAWMLVGYAAIPDPETQQLILYVLGGGAALTGGGAIGSFARARNRR